MSDIPIGDIQLYDFYKPSLEGGNYYVDLQHTVLNGAEPVNTGDALGAKQEFVVTAPQFSMDTTEVLSFFPPASSTAQYGAVLPHVVLSEPMLPWERNLGTDEVPQPWLALLVLSPAELPAATATGTGTVATTVGEFLAPASPSVLKPDVKKADDIPDDAPMTYIEISTDLFRAVTPRLDELRFLAHCRRVNTGDKAILGLREDGLFSVVVANRFPETPPTSAGSPVRSLVHLVSLEGFEKYLVDDPPFGGQTSVALASLTSWSFSSLPAASEDFTGLVAGLIEHGTGPLVPSSAGIDRGTAAGAAAAKRLDDGFVPVPYCTRTGEGTMGWYRGPFVPKPTSPVAKAAPFATADAAAAYDTTYAVFDHSLAAAFEIGRGAALADKAFGQQLLDFRRRAYRFTDTLLERLEGDHFRQTDIAALSGATVQTELLALLQYDVLADIGRAPAAQPAAPPAPPAGPDSSPQEALAALMADPDTWEALRDAVAIDLDPVTSWLGRLLLLYQVPFHHLVPDPALLPPETLRFFYVDRNWLDAMLDGAVSIGMESSRDTFFHQNVGDVIIAAAYEELETVRENLGAGPAAPSSGTDAMTGLLLRSDIVAGWPSLAVRAYDGLSQESHLMKTLRMDRLSPGILLCIFSGVPARVQLAEPQEGFRFGLEEEGKVDLRYVSGSNLGLPKTDVPTVVVWPDHLRDGTGRVLGLAPSSPTGLVQTLAGAVGEGGVPVPDFGPSDFALQMVSAPESVDFDMTTSEAIW